MTHLLKIKCSVSHVLQVPEENIQRVLSESATERAHAGSVESCAPRNPLLVAWMLEGRPRGLDPVFTWA